MSKPQDSYIPKAVYACDGARFEFPVTFAVDRSLDVYVYLSTDATGETRRMVRNQDYTVREESGVLTVVTRVDDHRDPWPTGKSLVIQRGMTIVQPSGKSSMSPKVFSNRVDSLTRNFQQQREQLDRTLFVGLPYPERAERSAVYPNTVPPYIIACGQSEHVFRSRTGAVFENVLTGLNLRQWIDICYQPTRTRFFMVSSDGWVAHSNSRGESWVEAAIGSGIRLNSVDHDPEHDVTVVCGGHPTNQLGFIYRSLDGGATWLAPSSPPVSSDRLFAVKYIPWANAWLIGANGPVQSKAIWYSLDNGDTWARATGYAASGGVNGFDYSSNMVVACDDSGGGATRAYRSSNITDWTLAGSSSGEFGDVAFGNSVFLQVGNASGGLGNGSRSTNNGAGFANIASLGAFVYNGATFVQSVNTFIAVSESEIIKYSTDNGATFAASTITTPVTTQSILAVTSDSPATR